MIKLSQAGEKKLSLLLVLFSAAYFVYKIPENMRAMSQAKEMLKLSEEIYTGGVGPAFYLTQYSYLLFSAVPLIIFGGFYIYKMLSKKNES